MKKHTFFLLLLLASCVASQSPSIYDSLKSLEKTAWEQGNTWIGGKTDELTTALGAPNKVVEIGDGKKIFVYENQKNLSVGLYKGKR